MSKHFAPPATRYGQSKNVSAQPANPSQTIMAKAAQPNPTGSLPRHLPVTNTPIKAPGSVSPIPPGPGFAQPPIATRLLPPSHPIAASGAVQPKQARHAPPPHGVLPPPTLAMPTSAPRLPMAGQVVQRAQLGIEMGYESYSDDSGDELVTIGAQKGKKGIKKTKVYERYSQKNQSNRNRFRAGLQPPTGIAGKRQKAKSDAATMLTSAMLSEIVHEFDTGTPGANTHIMVRSDDGATLYQANTATAAKLSIGKLMHGGKRVNVKVATARALATHKKLKNVHTEMYVLHKATDGVVANVANILAGKTVLVDKPCCKMCYHWMRKAGATVIDGTNFNTLTGVGRDAYIWTNPFTNESFSKKSVEDKTEIELQAYVNGLVP